MMATIPDLLPEDFAVELSELQTNAPSMGWPFVRRRMTAELGTDWQSKLPRSKNKPLLPPPLVKCTKRSPMMAETLPASSNIQTCSPLWKRILDQLNVLMSVYKRMDNALDTSEMGKEIAARLREELDYVREAKHMALYRNMLSSWTRYMCQTCSVS